jgi:ribosome hibernation promoting factor
MQLELTGRHLEITPALRRLVTTKITKLERKLNNSAVSAHVVLAREKHRHLTEINLHARGENFLHAVGDAANWEGSLSDALDKLAQQALKIKGKWQPWRRSRASKIRSLGRFELPAAADVAAAPPAAARVPARMPRILRTSRQPIEPMSVADAARALDRARDGVIVFLDTETAAITALYRCDGGELSLIEIEL